MRRKEPLRRKAVRKNNFCSVVTRQLPILMIVSNPTVKLGYELNAKLFYTCHFYSILFLFFFFLKKCNEDQFCSPLEVDYPIDVTQDCHKSLFYANNHDDLSQNVNNRQCRPEILFRGKESFLSNNNNNIGTTTLVELVKEDSSITRY